jgi:heme iron utilization protein
MATEQASGPADSELARTLVATSTTGALSTIGTGGYPFGSVVVYAADERGRPLMLLSDLAVHSANLAADARASLMVNQPGDGDPLDLARVTLVGDVAEVTGPEREAPLAHYQSVHPGGLGTDHGFRLYRLEVASVRFVGGFARMSWVDAGAYASTEPDPLAPHVAGIVGHMNADHADSLVLYCQVLAGRPGTTSATMTGIDRHGFTMLADGEHVRLAFDEDVTTSAEARTALVAMVHQARGAS